MTKRAFAIGFMLFGLAATPLSAQDTSAEDDATARRAYVAGRDAFAVGDYETALIRFREAYELSHRGELLYNIAQSLDRLRRDDETLEALRRYLEMVPNTTSRAEVEARIAVLDRMIERQNRLEHERMDSEAQAQERARQQTSSGAVGDDVGEPLDPVPPPRPPLHSAVFIATAALALGAGGVAVWTGLETLSLHDQYVTAEGNGAPLDERTQLYDDGTTYQTATNVLVISAGVLGAAAIIMAIFTDWEGGGSAETAGIRPQLDIDASGVALGASGWF